MPVRLGNDPFVGHQRYAGGHACAEEASRVRGTRRVGEREGCGTVAGALYAEQGAP